MIKVFLVSLLVVGCTFNLQVENEYILQKGDGDAAQSELGKESAEASANVKAEIDGGAL